MKAHQRRQQEHILSVFKGLLAKLLELGPVSDSPEDLEGFGNVRGYLLDRIDEYERRLTKAAQRTHSTRGRKPASLRLKGNGLHAVENAVDNPVSAEVANG